MIDLIVSAMREVHTEDGTPPLPDSVYAQMAIAAVMAMRPPEGELALALWRSEIDAALAEGATRNDTKAS